jgi:hypothetical protein
MTQFNLSVDETTLVLLSIESNINKLNKLQHSNPNFYYLEKIEELRNIYIKIKEGIKV